MEPFQPFFTKLTSHDEPREWQKEIADGDDCVNRLIRIPTGFGKTLGVLAAWAWHRINRQDDRWPRRLVWCLPMRVLVEQTENEVRSALDRIGVLWDRKTEHSGKVGVHLLMGGVDSDDWHLYPEHCAVLIGYAARRARWPTEFGLLNHDCLWVMDEVQLMDVGLATSAQLQVFRREDTSRSLRPCHTWWMSATLQRKWLEKSPDTQSLVKELSEARIAPRARTGYLWDDVHKRCEVKPIKDAKAIAKLVAEKHVGAGRGRDGITLVVVNTVERAVKVRDALIKEKSLRGSDIRLVHSRFRPAERDHWKKEFLNKEVCVAGTDRIIVATQIIEAGIDLSAAVLVTELAPWASLVQRFGRCARWGGNAEVVVADLAPKDDKNAAPYSKDALDVAREALNLLPDVAPLHLEAFEESHAGLLPRLYPYEPQHLLLRHELDELFDTTPDLSGADIDISRFIRSGEERDLHVFWADVPGSSPESEQKPPRAALCAVPFLKARDWLRGEERGKKKDKRAWVWDWLDGGWRVAERRDLYPGQTVLVAAECGGYDPETGWSPASEARVNSITLGNIGASDQADDAQDDESLSAYPSYQTIATHGRETGKLARELARALAPSYAGLLELAGRWHDAGKVHPAFNQSIVATDRPARDDLAKAPKAAWLKGKRLYPMPDGTHRPGFRHEIASVLALFCILQRHNPDHPALLGPWRELLEKAGFFSPLPHAEAQRGGQGRQGEIEATPLEQEILVLDADSFNLLAYLVGAHHGKVRLAWHASPADQKSADGALRIRGIREGDILPALVLATADGSLHALPETPLDLAPAAAGLSPRTGAGWTERVLGLLERHGPFALAWFEALLRAADQRASKAAVADPLLEADNQHHELERSYSTLANPPGGGKATSPVGEHSPQRGPEHGLRAGAGGSGDAGSGTRQPAHATRHVETSLGNLSYAELAPHLALAVQVLEEAVQSGEFDDVPLDDELILELHRRICAELTPQFTGWRRSDVCVGSHTPPEYYRVPVLMREYARDLQARIAGFSVAGEERLIETLAFAEGRLLSIHPFADFNGRVTRVFLRLFLRRLDLPVVRLAPASESTPAYLTGC